MSEYQERHEVGLLSLGLCRFTGIPVCHVFSSDGTHRVTFVKNRYFILKVIVCYKSIIKPLGYN